MLKPFVSHFKKYEGSCGDGLYRYHYIKYCRLVKSKESLSSYEHEHVSSLAHRGRTGRDGGGFADMIEGARTGRRAVPTGRSQARSRKRRLDE